MNMFNETPFEIKNVYLFILTVNTKTNKIRKTFTVFFKKIPRATVILNEYTIYINKYFILVFIENCIY